MVGGILDFASKMSLVVRLDAALALDIELVAKKLALVSKILELDSKIIAVVRKDVVLTFSAGLFLRIVDLVIVIVASMQFS